MRTLFVLVVFVSAARAEPPGLTEPVLAPPSSVAPIEPVEDTTAGEPSYWHQTALLDVAAVGAMALAIEAESSELVIGSLIAYAITGPTVHAMHHHGGRAVGSLLLRVSLPIVGGFAFDQTGNGYEGFLIGFAVGMGTAMIIDSALLARGTPAKPRVAPMMAPVAGGGTVGIRGAF